MRYLCTHPCLRTCIYPCYIVVWADTDIVLRNDAAGTDVQPPAGIEVVAYPEAERTAPDPAMDLKLSHTGEIFEAQRVLLTANENQAVRTKTFNLKPYRWIP